MATTNKTGGRQGIQNNAGGVQGYQSYFRERTGRVAPKSIVRRLLVRHNSGDISASRLLLHLHLKVFNLHLFHDRDDSRQLLNNSPLDFQLRLEEAVQRGCSFRRLIDNLCSNAFNGCPASCELIIELAGTLDELEGGERLAQFNRDLAILAGEDENTIADEDDNDE